MTVTTEHTERPSRARTEGGDRFVAGALLGLAVLLAIYQVVTAPFLPPLAIFTVLYGVMAIVVWRSRRRWPLVVAAVLAITYLVGGFPVFVEHLAHPESPLGFVTDALLAIGIVTVVLGAITTLRGGSDQTRRRIAAGAGVGAVLAVAISLVATATLDSPAAQDGDVAIEVVDWVFPDLTVPHGAATLWIDNQDPFHHTFVVDGTPMHVDLPASTAVRVPFDLPPGIYDYRCDVPGHEAMVGVLQVR